MNHRNKLRFFSLPLLDQLTSLLLSWDELLIGL